jgi:hypothetical protein
MMFLTVVPSTYVAMCIRFASSLTLPTQTRGGLVFGWMYRDEVAGVLFIRPC